MDPIIDNKMVDLESDNLEHFNSESDIDSLTGFSPKSSEMMGGQTPESEETEDLESLSELETTDKDVEKREAEKDDEYEDEDEDLREGIEEQDDAPMASTQDTTELTALSTMEREDDFEVEDDEEIKEATSSDVESKDPSKLMDIEYTYPPPKDKNFQEKIFKKREFYYHRPQTRDELKEYPDIKAYRDKICAARFELQEHQALLSNFMNPDTPYNGLLIFHGVGTGKCIAYDTYLDINGVSKRIDKIWKEYNSGIMMIDEEGGEWSVPNEKLQVISFSSEAGRFVNGKVKHLYREKVRTMIRSIQLTNGDKVRITSVHQLLTPEGWTNKLEAGALVAIYSEHKGELSYVTIQSVNLEQYEEFVYDLEVEEYHNFAISNGILCHNTCAGISIAEKYKPMIQKYGTKIYVLVSGPFIKENWRNELLKCTGETYLKKQDATQYISQAEQQKAVKNAINVAMQYYRFMSYRSFYKKVLGEKIREQEKVKDNKVKVTYRKTEEGEFERDIAIDRIYNLNNSLIIVDEAHNLTGNAYGEALMKIIRASSNLKVILLTATPMKNLADDIIELVNFIRPANSPIERDRIFNAYKNHQMDFKEGGIDYLKQMAKGYISYLRGADPLTFAKRIEKGTIPKGLLFTKVISCQMLDFQRKTYDEIIRTAEEDTLDRRSEAVANFSFPGLTQDRKEIMGYYGNEGLNIIKNQLKTHYELLNKKIATDILGVEEGDTDFMYLTEESNTISGKILKSQYLKYFSVKFYKALKKISRLIWSKKGARTAFIYSNLVKVGIEIFQEILLQNGYLEYDENPSNYKIKPDTICYFCGHTYRDHQQMQLKATAEMKRPQDRSESSTEYELKRGEPPQHNFMPATFISVTGKTSEEAADIIPEDKKRILDNVFSHIDNKEGKYIKFVLGSRVMQEGLSLMNVAEVHILDVYFNLGKVEQVTGRAIRHCSHYKLITDENRFPTVSIYKYALTLDGKELSSEEEMYQKAELKYLLIKKVERAIKEVAIDCPLNRAANIFPEELAQYKECVPPTDMKEGEVMCPPLCDYTRCNFICDEENLNRKYYDEKSNSYRKLSKNELDYSTFTQSLARNEIETTKGKIKEMFRIKYVYTLSEIIDYVKKSYTGEKKELFDEFFIFKALDELIPITENDFNNFRDTVFDKFNRAGYLVYINKYYIFQPFDQNEDVPMFYRSTYDKPMKHELTLYNYLKNTEKLRDLSEDILEEKEREISEEIIQAYDFDSVMEYYEERNEFKYVGIIDKESTRRRTKRDEELQDVFKIRESRAKVLEKKRGTGITSLLGAVCNSRSKDYLDSVAKSVNIKLTDEMTRDETCDLLKNRLLFLEKYSHGKDKKTYMIVPANHSKYPFPLNLEDRKNNIMDKIKDKIKFKIDVKVHDHKKKIENESVITYTVEIKYEKKLEDFKGFFEGLGGKFDKNRWLIDIE